MGRPAEFRFFKCPSCAALYQVVKAEAGPETEASELACLTCVAPLSPRDGKFVLKYFLLREGACHHSDGRHRWRSSSACAVTGSCLSLFSHRPMSLTQRKSPGDRSRG